MTDFDVFLPSIMPFAPGCAEPVAVHNIRLAAQEFCERTRLWRESDQFAVSAATCEFVCVPDGAELYEIESAMFGTQQLDAKSIKDLDRDVPGWRTEGDSQPRWITQLSMDTVRLVPAGTGTVTLHTTLRPADDAEQLPDFLAKHHRQVIAEGALARILLLPGQSFTDAQMAVFYAGEFERKVSALFNRSIKGQQRAPARTRPNFM